MRGEKAMTFIFTIFAVIGLIFAIFGIILGLVLREVLFMLPYTLVGLIFFSIGMIALVRMGRQKKERERLYREGYAVTLPVLRTGIDTTLSVNGENPFQLTCEDRDPTDNTVRRYMSQKLWFDPFLLMAELGINELNVYIDRNDPEKYVVDVRQLIEENEKRSH